MNTNEAATTDLDVCQHCLDTHALPMAIENFADSRGFDVYDLPLFADEPAERVTWDTITRETKFEAAYAYLRTVGADYLRAGDVDCYCK